jgi:hypothetical protein
MSHVADVSIRITDLDALNAACERLCLVLRKDQKTHAWFGKFLNDWSNQSRAAIFHGYDPKTFGHCEHAIRAAEHDHGDYEIGLVKPLDGSPGWDAVYDTYGRGARLEYLAGTGLTKLKQEYAAEVATRQLRRQGYRIIRSNNKITGEISLSARRS